MEKIDRLGWTAGFSILSGDLAVGVRLNEPSLLDELAAIVRKTGQEPAQIVEEVDILFSLRVGAKSGRKGQRHYHLLYVGPGRAVRTLSRDELLEEFQQHFLRNIGFTFEHQIALNAGLAMVNERALLLPGEVNSGRSTLLRALRGLGAEVLAEDYVTIDADGQVVVGHQKVQPDTIAFVDYSETARKLVPRKLTPGNTALQMFPFIFARPAIALPILAKIATAATKSFKGRRGDAQAAAAYLVKQMS